MNIEFRIQTSDTERQYWSFWLNGSTLILDSFQFQEKPKGARVWRMKSGYSRIKYNGMPLKMAVSDVPFSEQIAETAKSEFIRKLTVEKERI